MVPGLPVKDRRKPPERTAQGVLASLFMPQVERRSAPDRGYGNELQAVPTFLRRPQLAQGRIDDLLKLREISLSPRAQGHALSDAQRGSLKRPF